MSTALQQSPQQKVAQVRTLLNSDGVRKQIMAALPRHMTAERYIRVINTAITKTPKLAECEQVSLMSAIIQASELGLEPLNTSLGYAYLIPYGREVQFQIGYRGYIELARRSQKVKMAVAEVVYSNDTFEIEFGLNRNLIHKPNLGDRGEPIGAYSVVEYIDGEKDFEYMTKADIEHVRKSSKSAGSDSSPWKQHTMEMWRKTPMRRHAKRWPLSPEDADLIVRDEHIEYGISDVPAAPVAPKIDEAARTHLVNLARECDVKQDDLRRIVSSFGCDILADITTDKLEDVENAIRGFHAVEADADVPQEAENASDGQESGNTDALRASLEALVDSVGLDKLSPGQQSRFEKRVEMDAEGLQKLYNEVEKRA